MINRLLRIKYAFVVTFIIGIFIGWILTNYFSHQKEEQFFSQIQSIRVEDKNYKFINPLISYDLPESSDIGKLGALKKEIGDFVRQAEKSVNGSVSIYFKDLNAGTWIGIGEDEPYNPASLLKVPLMMTYLKLARNNEEILDQQITFEKAELRIKLAIPESEFITRGRAYTVRELLEALIVHSDNTAKNMLVANIDLKVINDFFKELKENELDISFGTDIISLKEYSLFFRAMYNANLLGRKMSEYALGLLAQTDFKEGLVAGVPANITVAHKYGHYRSSVDGDVIEQLHDCGVIYYPQKNYLLCVMTQGNNFERLKEVVVGISKIVYAFVDKN